MADDKRGRDKQARDAERRQQEREIDAAVERGDEPEPPLAPELLDDVEAELEAVSFPATGAEVVAAVGDHEIRAPTATYTVAELVPDADEERFESPATVRKRVRRPRVAATMKRIVEATATLQRVDLDGSQRTGYEKTLTELATVAPDTEGVETIGDWIVDRIRDDGTLPGSRAVRREAASFCRERGYDVSKDDWLGI
ncbi:hypothetical protein GRS48_09690 [Halorubrum sp. JWXQ-INN 858]|uniref:DUF5789 family protein n=1 Tax=Halorubrum sp. JWXQ-INN 858 TaxID=2690782 RepID=UPI0013582B81|nr:hypothetical protein [Halorubrum sp. JWXQ-INN 858]MWV65088.1 hypothetical protein [Halorubrum sp. JWXQ-INN 858]